MNTFYTIGTSMLAPGWYAEDNDSHLIVGPRDCAWDAAMALAELDEERYRAPLVLPQGYEDALDGAGLAW